MSSARVRGPIVELTLARLREFVREPEALFWAFMFPVVMSLAIAIAFPQSGSKRIVIGVLRPGAAATAAGATTASAAGSDGAIADMRGVLSEIDGLTVKEIDPTREERAIRDGEVDLVLVPTTPPTYRYDGSRDESRLARAVVDDALKQNAGRRDPWTARDDVLNVPGSRYVDWLIPGIVGMGIMSNGMWSIAFSIVQARMRKLLKRLVASPMRRRDYLVAQLLSRLTLLLPEVTVPLVFGAFLLGVPIRGSWIVIAVVALVGAVAFGGIGLLAASRTRTFEGISAILNLTMLPMWVLSGVFFSASRFPAPVQPVIQLLPLTVLNNALRASILEGTPLTGLTRELSTLAAWAFVSFGLALRLFRWR